MKTQLFENSEKIVGDPFIMILMPDSDNSNYKKPRGQCIKLIFRMCGLFAIAFMIASLFFTQNSFGQAGPVRLKGSGGTVTEINVSGTFYEVHSYTATGSTTFTPPSGAANVEYLVVAGGGGGGNSSDRTGGGGGAGGVLSSSSFGVTVQGYTVTVGAGGAANTAGGNSVFATFTAVGGGRGGQSGSLATSGGSGGGGYHNAADAGRAGTAGQGTAGGNGFDGGGTINQFGGGGGGGQSQVGANAIFGQAGKGGNGFTSLISGTSTVYAGGGGGGYERLSGSGGLAGVGGTGGGGAGAFSTSNTTSVNGTAATVNRGGGGGGAAGGGGGAGGAGGSGIVIIRYKAPTMAITTQPSATVLSGSNFAQPVVIQILDGNGSPVPGIVVTAAIQSGTGGTLSNNTATTDASGNATFTNLQLSGPAGNSYTLNFKVPGSGNIVVSNAISICSNPITSVTGTANISCFGNSDGTITILASNGTGPYNYSVDNGVNWTPAVPVLPNPYVYGGLIANQAYKIRVRDSNGCVSK